MKQLVRYWKPIYQDVYAEWYYWDESWNLYGKTNESFVVDRMVVWYNFEWEEYKEEEIPICETRCWIQIKPILDI
jgi:uncharacterized membrane protein YedE/YeeE